MVKALIRRCLRRDPARRLHDIADARIEIEEVLTEAADDAAGLQRGIPSMTATGLGTRQRGISLRAAATVGIVAVTVAAAVTATAYWGGLATSPPSGRPTYVDLNLPPGRQKLRLPLEARQALMIAGELFGQHLDGDVAAQARVAGPIDLAHAAGAQQFVDLVITQRVADQRSRVLPSSSLSPSSLSPSSWPNRGRAASRDRGGPRRQATDHCGGSSRFSSSPQFWTTPM